MQESYLSILRVMRMHADLAQRLGEIVHVDAPVAVEVEALEQPLQAFLVLGRQLVEIVRRRRRRDRARHRRRARARTAAVPRHITTYVSTYLCDATLCYADAEPDEGKHSRDSETKPYRGEACVYARVRMCRYMSTTDIARTHQPHCCWKMCARARVFVRNATSMLTGSGRALSPL